MHRLFSSVVLLFLIFETISAASQLPYTQSLRQKRSLDGEDGVCSMTRSCANVGQSCGSVQTNSIVETGCNGYSLCNITSSTGLQSKGTCVAIPKPTQSCAGLNECMNGYVCNLATQTCVLDVVPAASWPGSSCTTNNQCIFLQPNGTVTNNCDSGQCRFVPNLGSCTYSGIQCNVLTSFCNSSDNLCHPRLAIGAVCNLQLSESGCPGSCIPPFQNSTTGVCKPSHSSQANQLCSFDDDCNEGLVCSPAPAGQYGVCQSVKTTATLYQPCTSDDNCSLSNSEYCSCNTLRSSVPICTVDVVPVGYTAANTAYETCASAKCVLSNGEYNTTCLTIQCLRQMCTFVQLAGTVSDNYASDCFLKNTLLPMCATLPTPSPTTTPDLITKSSPANALVVSLPVIAIIAFMLVV